MKDNVKIDYAVENQEQAMKEENSNISLIEPVLMKIIKDAILNLY